LSRPPLSGVDGVVGSNVVLVSVVAAVVTTGGCVVGSDIKIKK